ncbi:hypothetical protein D3C71_1510660 [compost metagenome]
MNLPRPGFCASISAAISTIQPVPSDMRRPVKIMGTAAGRTMRRTCASGDRLSTLLTLFRSCSMLATPTVVLITVGHRQHSATVMAEVRKDLANSGSSLT